MESFNHLLTHFKKRKAADTDLGEGSQIAQELKKSSISSTGQESGRNVRPRLDLTTPLTEAHPSPDNSPAETPTPEPDRYVAKLDKLCDALGAPQPFWEDGEGRFLGGCHYWATVTLSGSPTWHKKSFASTFNYTTVASARAAVAMKAIAWIRANPFNRLLSIEAEQELLVAYSRIRAAVDCMEPQMKKAALEYYGNYLSNGLFISPSDATTNHTVTKDKMTKHSALKETVTNETASNNNASNDTTAEYNTFKDKTNEKTNKSAPANNISTGVPPSTTENLPNVSSTPALNTLEVASQVEERPHRFNKDETQLLKDNSIYNILKGLHTLKSNRIDAIADFEARRIVSAAAEAKPEQIGRYMLRLTASVGEAVLKKCVVENLGDWNLGRYFEKMFDAQVRANGESNVAKLQSILDQKRADLDLALKDPQVWVEARRADLELIQRALTEFAEAGENNISTEKGNNTQRSGQFATAPNKLLDRIRDT